MPQVNAALPRELSDRFTKPFARFLKIEAAASALLFVVTAAALILANSRWSAAFLGFWEMSVGVQLGSLDFTRSLRHWINDGLMTLFFFVVALELKRELVVGELQNVRAAALPLAAAIGGMVVPVAIYLTLMGDESGSQGWGTVMATDTAFLIGCLALFGPRIPASLRLFLLSLAIFDDVGAILVVALGYGETLDWRGVASAAAGLVAAACAARLGFRGLPIYFVLGAVVWLGLDFSGIHATLAGVLLGLMTPVRAWVSDSKLHAILGRVLSYPPGEHWSGDTNARHDLRRARIAATEAVSPLERLELSFHPWVGFAVMPLFALANAGVVLPVGSSSVQPVSAAIFAGLVLGKPAGVVTMSWVAVRLGLAERPKDLSWPFLVAGAFLTGIGFTMSLFVAELAYATELLNTAKLAILLSSAVSAVAGVAALTWLVHRRAPPVSS